MVEFFGIPNIEYIGGIGGIILIIVLFWFMIRRSKSGRMGLEREEIEEDKELLNIDKKALKEEKDEKYQAKKLYDLFLRVHKRSRKIGLKEIVDNRIRYLNFIIRGLNILISEEISVTREKMLMEQINNAINLYLNNFPVQDKKLRKWVPEIRDIQNKLYGDIVTEETELREKERLLRKGYEETQSELAA